MKVVQQRERAAKLLGLFSSARSRPSLTCDEVLIFLAIGYLSVVENRQFVEVRPTSFVNVATLLGIPKETVRRKAAKLIDLEYISSSPKGILIKQLDVWSQMLERVAA